MLHRWWRGDVGLGLVVTAGVLLTAFPVFWSVDSLAWYRSLDNIFLARQQFSGVTEADCGVALRWMPLDRPLLLELVWKPATLLGLGMLVWLCRRYAVLRAWVVVFGVPLLLTSGITVAMLSIPLR